MSNCCWWRGSTFFEVVAAVGNICWLIGRDFGCWPDPCIILFLRVVYCKGSFGNGIILNRSGERADILSSAYSTLPRELPWSWTIPMSRTVDYHLQYNVALALWLDTSKVPTLQVWCYLAHCWSVGFWSILGWFTLFVSGTERHVDV